MPAVTRRLPLPAVTDRLSLPAVTGEPAPLGRQSSAY
jgi:hypothetical protein